MPRFDSLIVNGDVVLPDGVARGLSIGIVGGKIVEVSPRIRSADANEVVNAEGMTVFPGAVDAHYHLGMNEPLEAATEQETQSSAVGGVTSVLSYIRTGHGYLERSELYKTFFPDVLAAANGRAYVDYGFHLAPILTGHLDEIPELVNDMGVASFKNFMFYKGLNLRGDLLEGNDSYTMADNPYDLGYLYEIMEQVSAVNRSRNGVGRVSLSLHCEHAEIIRIFMDRVKTEGKFTGVEAYSRARPPLSEVLAIREASTLAQSTSCPVNFLHISSAEAVEAAIKAKQELGDIGAKIETTLHHLTLNHETDPSNRNKVNPPVRTKADNDRLWQAVMDGDIDWVASDHGWCFEEEKFTEDVWTAEPGFGGTALLYPGMITEAKKRGLGFEKVAHLVATNAADSLGLGGVKGRIEVGADADLAIIDTEAEKAVTPEFLRSRQDWSPWTGQVLSGWVQRTILRGKTIALGGEIVGTPQGEYLHRI